MKELFLGLCSASIIPSIAVLAAILLRPLLKKGPSFLRCVIWAVVFARLVIPVGLIELPASVSPFPSPAEEIVSQSVSEAVQNDVPNVVPGTVSTPYTDVPNVVPDSVPTLDTDVAQPVPGAASPEESTVDVVEILSLVWVCGIIVMLGYLTASSLLLHYQVRDAVVYDSRVRVLGQNCSPFVSGFFRPLIYIPASANRADWPYYIAHEESHIKRFDHILKPLAFLVLCVHWFNPLVWAAYLLLSKDIEYACDEKTVKNMAEADRKAYSLALLSVSQGGSPVFSPLSFGKVSVKERITRIMKGKIPVWAICLTVVLCAALLTLMVCTAAGTSEEASSEVSDETSGETSEGTSSEVSNETSNETSGETSSEVSNETSGETSGGTTVAGIEADYKNASSLHVQDPETYRDPGELQSETREMVQLEDGQWYQSYVASDVNIRYVFLSNAEYEMNANWDFIPIGSEKTYYLYNAGARFEDETGVARYVERPIAVWGELDGGDGEKYSRVLVLTDELTVCVEGEGGTCAFYQTDRIALPRWLGPLFWDKDEFDSEMVTGVVMLDEDGIFYLKDVALFLPTPLKAAYVNALSLHAQDPETYRDPGDLQYETQEMVQLENGQWYQSFVSTSANVRYVFLSNVEYEISAKWDFFPIGSAKNYFLLNFGTQYEDASGLAPYVERQIAVRGTLADGSNGYAYTLRLPDELTVCVEGENGVCDFCEAETLAVSLPDGMTGEKVLTGVVSRDENGVLYLKDASVYASVGPGSPSEGQAVTMGAFVREPEFLRLQQTVYRFLSDCIRTDQKGALAFARNVDTLPA